MAYSFRTRWLALLAGILFIAAACSGGGGKVPATAVVETPATVTSGGQTSTRPAEVLPAGAERVQLAVNVSTRYYAVQGATTTEIFASIDRNAPVNDKKVKGVGLAATNWSYKWQPQPATEGCIVQSMTITLDIVVTLPQHAQRSALGAQLGGKWDAFEASVDRHEQTHVDIDQAGARSIRDKMAALKAASSCDALSKQVEGLWDAEQKAVDTAQNQFHLQEDARIAGLRAPLQSRIDANRRRIAQLGSQIQSLDASLASMNAQLAEVTNQLNALKGQLDDTLSQYPSGNLPPDVFAIYEDLRRIYNSLAPTYNQLVSQYNSSIAQRNEVAGEHDSLVAATNELVDEFNWTR